MSTKKLKVGQLCTINGDVFQCRKSRNVCKKCEEENGVFCIMKSIGVRCTNLFVDENYPKFIRHANKKS